MKQKLISWIILILLIPLLYIWSNHSKSNYKYIDATVISDFQYKNTFGGSGYDYIFYLDNKEYIRGESKGNFTKGHKYIAVYDSLDPRSGLLLQVDITDSIYKSPKNGWKLKEIPFPVDTIYIKKRIENL